MSRCPHCGQSVPDLESRIAKRLQELLQACEDHQYFVTPDGRVREEIAALFLDKSPGTLRNWSYGDSPIQPSRIAGRRTYRLTDIAALLEER